MTISKFEDMIAWQKAQQLCVLLYVAMRETKDYNFRDQLLRAVVSISNNIAEGFDRYSKRVKTISLYCQRVGCRGKVHAVPRSKVRHYSCRDLRRSIYFSRRNL